MTQHNNLIRTTKLDNGARIITEVVEGVYSASIGIWIDVGSEDESEKTNGTSHCLEHMLFKGRRKEAPNKSPRKLKT
jgi:predicted Zn-dependent peptidase